ncbi:META domain-containing protein [Dokdonia sp. 4H-3-7-5]|uniref:META domain-containing protein n=1 Tax=Dokdonia sp. (strain 4H-3-7-5) TaxID=983548 RepID=UPI00020A6496|nr:META domain-containing protein [Dokdonia sp. 4H-3-7-5]AEE19471.1 protein of unknown function DUF306 Meta and HslJ [Dokdonia sp. 4H-3-7-5]
MKHTYYIIALAIGLFLSSCATEKKESEPDVKAPRFSGYYTLTSIEETPITKQGITFNIESQKRRITGFSGCNSYNAAFTLTKDKLDITDPLSTKKACPAEAMDLEKKVFKNLIKVNRYTLKNGTLTLYNEDQVLFNATSTAL